MKWLWEFSSDLGNDYLLGVHVFEADRIIDGWSLDSSGGWRGSGNEGVAQGLGGEESVVFPQAAWARTIFLCSTMLLATVYFVFCSPSTLPTSLSPPLAPPVLLGHRYLLVFLVFGRGNHSFWLHIFLLAILPLQFPLDDRGMWFILLLFCSCTNSSEMPIIILAPALLQLIPPMPSRLPQFPAPF